MTWQPTIGTVLVARAPRHHRLAGVGSAIDIAVGTRLEVVRVDERWDNVHAMIIQGYELTVDLRVLDGESRGEIVTETIRGEVLTCVGEEFEGYALPGWADLRPPSTATGG